MLKRIFSKLSIAPETSPLPITIVSGLPRSGTSMMMRMLAAGGLPILADGERTADDDNPKGYYEFERVKKLKDGDFEWLPQAQGKVVKVVSPLLEYLPQGYPYRIVFMRRDLGEVLASQRKMMVHRGGAQEDSDDAQLERLYQKHLSQVGGWLQLYPHIQVDYRSVIEGPGAQVARLVEFLGPELQAEAMLAVVDPGLYRQRVSE